MTDAGEASATGNTLDTAAGSAGYRQVALAVIAILVVLSGALLLAFTLFSNGGSSLYPNLPTFTPPAEEIGGEPELVGFAELNADPAAYRDQRIQVSGVYTPMPPPSCRPHAGPLVLWSLVSEELQLNAVGFEDVLRLVSADVEMTVSGVWRLYQGPLGCGKEPADGNLWYLAVDQILEPNPLLGGTGAALTVIAGSPPPPLATLDLSPTETAEATVTPMPTEIPPLGGTPSVTPPLLTGTPTPPLVTPLFTETPDLTGTPGQTVTPGPSPTPSPTGTVDLTGTPGIPTVTPLPTNYPVPPTATATTDPYGS